MASRVRPTPDLNSNMWLLACLDFCMYMYVCMYMCVYVRHGILSTPHAGFEGVCVRACVCECMYACMNVCIYTVLSVCMYMCV